MRSPYVRSPLRSFPLDHYRTCGTYFSFPFFLLFVPSIVPAHGLNTDFHFILSIESENHAYDRLIALSGDSISMYRTRTTIASVRLMNDVYERL